MCDFEFKIPIDLKDLQDNDSDAYYVQNICILSEIKDKLKQAKDAFHYDGPEAILNHFDTYYSILFHGEKISLELINQALQELVKPCQQLCIYLESILDSDIPQETQLKTLNILKMILYLITHVTLLLETKIDTKNRIDLNKIKKGARGKKANMNDENFNVEKRTMFLKLFLRIIGLPICKLWEPPVVEEQFINLVAEVCFTFLMNPLIKFEKDMWVLIFDIFGKLIKNYNYSLTFNVRLTQVIKNHEHLESIVPEGIMILVEEYNSTGLVRKLVRELTEWQSDEVYHDAPGAKHCSVVLTEMTALMPNLMLPEVVYLLKYLNNSSYTLRNCILCILTEVILKVLTNENITKEQIEVRNELLRHLELHICDINAHVRSKVLQQWIKLHSESAIPKDIQARILQKVCKRLQDKSTLVRKYAIQLVTTFLKCNPYAATLDLDFYASELQKEVEQFKDLNLDEQTKGVLEKMTNNESEWKPIEDEIKSVIKECLEENLEKKYNEDEMEVDTVNKSNEVIISLINEKKYKEAFLICKEFSNTAKNSEEIENLPIEKRVEFFSTLMQSIYFDIRKEAENFVNLKLQMLAQKSSEEIKAMKKSEENVKYLSDVVSFLEIIDKQAFPIIKNLLKSATMTDVQEAIEFFVCAHQFKIKGNSEGLAAMLEQMNTTEQERINAVITAYGNVFLTYEGPSKDKAATIASRLVALLKAVNVIDIQYLSCVMKQWGVKGDLDQSIIQQFWHLFTGQIQETTNDDRICSLQILSMISTGKKTIIERNMNLVAEIVFGEKCLEDPRYLIIGCDMIGIMEDEINIESKNPCFRVPNDDQMWEHLIEKVEKIFKRKDPFAHTVIKSAVELIYKIAQKPDLLATKLIRNLVSYLKDFNSNNLNTVYLSLFCRLLGEVAVRQFNFLDTTVYKELKRRNNIKDERVKTQKKNKKESVLNMSKSSASSRSPKITPDSEESFLEGAQADDVDAEYILNVCEREIVSANLLGQFVPMLTQIVKNPSKYDDEELQSSAVLALIRFMIVSSQLCSKYLGIIIRILEETKFAAVKNNIFIALADLLHRFPNIVEPQTKHMFKVVKDKDIAIRMTAVSILSKLILEDMLRVKETIADLALCIVDESPEIIQMTEGFFNLLAQKGNTIYNVLPDILARLSHDSAQIDQDVFKKVMTFLVQLISKDKQIESLVEKLCLRFALSDKQRVWKDLAYCLTLLTYNEKSLLRLKDNFAHYKTCLEDDAVYDLFISIVNKYKTSSKDELKDTAKSLEQLIRTGEGNDADLLNESKNKTIKSKKPRTKRGKKPRVEFDDDE